MSFIDKIHKTSLVLVLSLAAMSVQAESYQCIAEQLAGFVFNPKTKTWHAGGSATEAGFIVKNPSEAGAKNIGPRWFVTEQGKDYGMACATDFDANGFLHCQGLGGDFLMNKKTLRFRYLQDEGYVVEQYTRASPEGKQGPHMKIGQCQPLPIQ